MTIDQTMLTKAAAAISSRALTKSAQEQPGLLRNLLASVISNPTSNQVNALKYGLIASALGGTAGLGMGIFSGNQEQDPKERRRRALMYALSGAGLGGAAGAALPYGLALLTGDEQSGAESQRGAYNKQQDEHGGLGPLVQRGADGLTDLAMMAPPVTGAVVGGAYGGMQASKADPIKGGWRNHFNSERINEARKMVTDFEEARALLPSTAANATAMTDRLEALKKGLARVQADPIGRPGAVLRMARRRALPVGKGAVIGTIAGTIASPIVAGIKAYLDDHQ